MKLCALDTTQAEGSLALFEDGVLCASRSWRAAKSHTALLPVQLSELLSVVNWEVCAIDQFAISVGPGSFTGVRVGLSFLKGLLFFSEKPVWPISTLEALALKASLKTFSGKVSSGLVCPMLDARRSEVYAALYQAPTLPFLPSDSVHSSLQSPPFFLSPLISERADTPERFLNAVKSLRAEGDLAKGPLFFFGTGARCYKPLIDEIFCGDARVLEEEFDALSAEEVGFAALQKMAFGIAPSHVDTLLPAYLRASEAERQREENS